MDEKVKVSVCMITYGHEKFIREAIEGVLIQECDFEVEIILANDCSPDQTEVVIQDILSTHSKASWIKYIKHDQNIGMMPNFIFALSQCSGDYIALCEGDDYWIDPFKLQKQVDFLEENNEFSICWTKYLIKQYSENSIPLARPDWISQIEQDKNVVISLSTIFRPYCTYTLTAMFKTDSFDLELLKTLEYSKDNSLYAICLSRGNGVLMNFYSSVYRIHSGGIYSSASVFNQKYFSYLNLKEITLKIPFCDNLNIKGVRNHLLSECIELHPNRFSFNYLNLLVDRFKFLGIKMNLVIIYREFKKYRNWKIVA